MQLLQVNNQINSLRQGIIQNQHQQVNLQSKLKTTEITYGKLNEQLTQFTKSLTQEQHILTVLKTTQQNTLAKLKLQNDALAQQLRATYQLGEMQQWKIMLNQQDPGSLSRHITYYRYLNQERFKLISAIKQNLLILSQSIQAANLHQQTLKNLLGQKRRQQNHLQHVINLRQNLMNEINQQTKTKQQQIEVLFANQKALQETIRKLKEQNMAIYGQSFSTLQGKLNWPIKGPLMTSYGSFLDVGTQRANGVMIKAEPGTPVKAIFSGKVIFADWLRGFGLLVIINHGHNYMSLYARNQTINKKVGQYVKIGEVIATTGNSGGFNKPGLYFEIRQNGSPVNPGIWCR